MLYWCCISVTLVLGRLCTSGRQTRSYTLRSGVGDLQAEWGAARLPLLDDAEALAHVLAPDLHHALGPLARAALHLRATKVTCQSGQSGQGKRGSRNREKCNLCLLRELQSRAGI